MCIFHSAYFRFPGEISTILTPWSARWAYRLPPVVKRSRRASGHSCSKYWSRDVSLIETVVAITRDMNKIFGANRCGAGRVTEKKLVSEFVSPCSPRDFEAPIKYLVDIVSSPTFNNLKSHVCSSFLDCGDKFLFFPSISVTQIRS